MAIERNPNDPYRSNPADDPYLPNFPDDAPSPGSPPRQ